MVSEVVNIEFAQAAIAEAEPHRRRFPNLACGTRPRARRPRGPLGAHSRQRPVREPLNPAGDAVLGIPFLAAKAAFLAASV